MASKHKRSKSDASRMSKLARLLKNKKLDNDVDSNTRSRSSSVGNPKSIGAVNSIPSTLKRRNSLSDLAKSTVVKSPQVRNDILISDALKAPTAAEQASFIQNIKKRNELNIKLNALKQVDVNAGESADIINARNDDVEIMEALVKSIDFTKSDVAAVLQQVEAQIDLAQKRKDYSKKLHELGAMMRSGANAGWKSTDNEEVAKRKSLLIEAANLRAATIAGDSWIVDAGGIDNITQEDVNRINQQKGLKIKSPAEFKVLYQQLAIADRYIRDNPRQTYDWVDIASQERINDQSKVVNVVKNAADTIEKKGLVLMNLSHDNQASAWGIREIINKVNDGNNNIEKGTVYIEAPLALSLHEDPAKAIGAWIVAAKTGFPKANYEVLVNAQKKGWNIVGLDALKVIDGTLDVNLIKASKIKGYRSKSELTSAMKSIPRQNFIARNLHTHLYKNGAATVGGVVTIGGLHIKPGRGGNLGGLVAAKQTNLKKVTEKVNITAIERNDFVDQGVTLKYQNPVHYKKKVKAGFHELNNNEQIALNDILIKANGSLTTAAMKKVTNKYHLSSKLINAQVKVLKRDEKIPYRYEYTDSTFNTTRRFINKALAGGSTLAAISDKYDIKWTLNSVDKALKVPGNENLKSLLNKKDELMKLRNAKSTN